MGLKQQWHYSVRAQAEHPRKDTQYVVMFRAKSEKKQKKKPQLTQSKKKQNLQTNKAPSLPPACPPSQKKPFKRTEN